MIAIQPNLFAAPALEIHHPDVWGHALGHIHRWYWKNGVYRAYCDDRIAATGGFLRQVVPNKNTRVCAACERMGK